MRKTKSRLPSLKCPHCQSQTIVRDSQHVTDTVRELRIVCTSDDCGFSAVAQLAFIRTIRAASSPNPDVRLPFGGWKPKPGNDNAPIAANDHGLGAALADVMT